MAKPSTQIIAEVRVIHAVTTSSGTEYTLRASEAVPLIAEVRGVWYGAILIPWSNIKQMTLADQ